MRRRGGVLAASGVFRCVPARSDLWREKMAAVADLYRQMATYAHVPIRVGQMVTITLTLTLPPLPDARPAVEGLDAFAGWVA